MDKRKIKYDIIQQRLGYLQMRIINSNSLNLTDVNIHAENFYRDFFNKLGFDFKNTNFDSQNAAFVDLIDSENKQAIQITAQNDNSKINEALIGFYKKYEHQGYKLQLLLIGKEAKDYTTNFGYNFDHKKDLLDIKRILNVINDFETSKIVEIADFLDNEILLPRNSTESTEVETIMSLIDFLSKEKNRTVSDKLGNVDPEQKIYSRFADHANYITDQYGALYAVYNTALAKANENMDGVMAIIISSYLKDESDSFLSKSDYNPKLALNEMVDYFYIKLSANGFQKFDKQAIRFYLLNEMIKCNVFPNSI